MPRLPRFDAPGYTQHIIQRGNNRNAVFFAPADYAYFLECLKLAADANDVDVHAYVLMTNHVHLLATPHRPQALSRLVQAVGRKYVRYVNYRNRRTGTLWEGRFKSTIIDSERYLLACYRYIELNPVRARMVAQPGDYPYSSYRCHAQGEAGSLIVDHPRYLALGATETSRQKAYRALFKNCVDPDTVQALREGTNKGWVVGDGRFADELESVAKRRVVPKPRGGWRAGAGRPAKDHAG